MLTKRLLKTAQTVYLHTDGHAVVLHSKRDPDVGTVEWATIHETIGVSVMGFPMTEAERQDGKRDLDTRGRLIVSRYAIPMLVHAKGIWWSGYSLENGSPATQQAGIRLGLVAIAFDETDWRHTFIYLPERLSTDWTPQTGRDSHQTFADVAGQHRWGYANVSETFYATKKAA